MGLSFLFIRVLEENRISSEHSFFFLQQNTTGFTSMGVGGC